MNRKTYKKFCAVCGKSFTTTVSHQKYCCNDCARKVKYNNRSKINEKICPICNKKYIAHTKNQDYCSNQCKLAERKSFKSNKKNTQKRKRSTFDEYFEWLKTNPGKSYGTFQTERRVKKQ